MIAELNTHAPARDHSECCSSLIAIWFQEQFGDTPAEIQHRIAELDWNRLAYDWTP